MIEKSSMPHCTTKKEGRISRQKSGCMKEGITGLQEPATNISALQLGIE